MPKVKIEVAVETGLADRAIEAIQIAAQTGQIGDGKIFVLPLELAVRVRTVKPVRRRSDHSRKGITHVFQRHFEIQSGSRGAGLLASALLPAQSAWAAASINKGDTPGC